MSGFALSPGHAEALYLLALIQVAENDPNGAAGSLHAALESEPGYLEARMTLGFLLSAAGGGEEAEACFREAVRLNPDYAQAHFNLGDLLRDTGEIDAAEAAYREAVRIDPNYLHALIDLGDTLLRLDADIFCPGIFHSTEEMDKRRAEIESALDSYSSGSDSPVSLDIDLNKLDFVQLPPYFMSFHGRNERPWKCKYADLFAGNFRRKHPENMTPVHTTSVHPVGVHPAGGSVRQGGRIRLGFLTSHTQEGPFLMWTSGLILNLPGDKFDISIFCHPMSRKPLVEGVLGEKGVEIPGLGERGNIRFIEIDGDLKSTTKRIRGEKLDVLIYSEVGTSTEKFILPFFRLAEVQCAYWCGFTSGIPGVDYFISSEAVEPENGQENYREKLVRLKSPMIHFTPPTLPPEPRERGHFGFAEANHIYACPQSLHKIHPDMDEIFGGILRRDPAGQVALLEGGTPHWTEALTRRLRKKLPDVAGRIRMLNRMTKEDFLGLLCISDVILDPVHSGGGTSAYDGLASGTPIVTWPGEFARGRFTSACYRRMGVADCVAPSLEKYVEIAVRLGTDPDEREAVGQKIRAASHLVYEDMDAVRDWEAFFEKAVEESLRKLP